jgi:Holliday junction resolvasome RuvABC endonuclease subunit
MILALDIATRTGCAFGVAGGIPRATTIRLDRVSGEPERFAEMLRATRGLIQRLKPDVLVYEAPIGGGTKVVLPGQLAACAAGEAARLGIPVHSFGLSTIRKHFLGKALSSRDFPGLSKAQSRTAIKRAVIARCLQLGWEVRNDDEADALALHDYASMTLGRVQSAPLGKLFTHERSAT